MKHSQESFLSLVQEAYDGRLQLPAFQRDWKWERSKVISLYDSLRKQFPIGSFLLLETSPEYDLSPRPYEGAAARYAPARLTLDGQQRITSGIVLLHGTAVAPRYFLNLATLRELAEQYRGSYSATQGLDYRSEEQVKAFVQDIDDGDNYMIATKRRTEADTLLEEDHLLSSIHLVSKVAAQRALERYEARYPETEDFLKYVVVPFFTLESSSNNPITTLTTSESLAAVTRIFATINTTGKRLTPIEIVTAVLYAHDINLKQKVKEFHEASDYLGNMDSDGEVLLQTIALLANEPPKKSLLPKTITFERFRAYYEEALDLLDKAGGFLTDDLGVGLKDTGKLVPYSSILAPMAVCFQDIHGLRADEKSEAREKMQRWFVGAAIGQRYIEGVGNKQENDARDMRRWIMEKTPESMPAWLGNVHITREMMTASPAGAIGTLLRCLINRNKPVDPLEQTKIGYYDNADEWPQEHHIWPTRFCTEHIGDWDKTRHTNDHALNTMPVASRTNRKWVNMDPKNQMDDIRIKISNEARRREVLDKLLLSEECVEILDRPTKSRQDYLDFLEARFRVLCATLALWDFTPGEEDYQEEPPDEIV